VKSQQPLPPGRRYSKTELRRGSVKPAQTPARPTQVAADEQAALFGELEPQNQTPPRSTRDNPPRQ
jgi:hypothetical protein